MSFKQSSDILEFKQVVENCFIQVIDFDNPLVHQLPSTDSETDWIDGVNRCTYNNLEGKFVFYIPLENIKDDIDIDLVFDEIYFKNQLTRIKYFFLIEERKNKFDITMEIKKENKGFNYPNDEPFNLDRMLAEAFSDLPNTTVYTITLIKK